MGTIKMFKPSNKLFRACSCLYNNITSQKMYWTTFFNSRSSIWYTVVKHQSAVLLLFLCTEWDRITKTIIFRLSVLGNFLDHCQKAFSSDLNLSWVQRWNFYGRGLWGCKSRNSDEILCYDKFWNDMKIPGSDRRVFNIKFFAVFFKI